MFPDTIDDAKVLLYTPKDNYKLVYGTMESVDIYFRYLVICKYDYDDGFYLFGCNEKYEVLADSLWDSIEICMSVANTSYGRELFWIER